MNDKFMDELAKCIPHPSVGGWMCITKWRLATVPCHTCLSHIGGSGLAWRPYITLSQSLSPEDGGRNEQLSTLLLPAPSLQAPLPTPPFSQPSLIFGNRLLHLQLPQTPPRERASRQTPTQKNLFWAESLSLTFRSEFAKNGIQQ